MRKTLMLPALLAAVLFAATAANAQETETDRLREALRQATLQARSAEDARNALQTKITKVESDNTALKGQLDKAKGKIRQWEKDYKQAVTDFNTRLEERNQQLEKWKEAYTEAATVARSKDAERAKFEAEANTYKASTQTCSDRNKELVKVNEELLADYKAVTLGDALLAQEPLTGIRRTQVQEKLEGYDERIQVQTFK
jgi:chromosome segregation ATPase